MLAMCACYDVLWAHRNGVHAAWFAIEIVIAQHYISSVIEIRLISIFQDFKRTILKLLEVLSFQAYIEIRFILSMIL